MLRTTPQSRGACSVSKGHAQITNHTQWISALTRRWSRRSANLQKHRRNTASAAVAYISGYYGNRIRRHFRWSAFVAMATKTRWKSTMKLRASYLFLVHNLCCSKCIELTRLNAVPFSSLRAAMYLAHSSLARGRRCISLVPVSQLLREKKGTACSLWTN